MMAARKSGLLSNMVEFCKFNLDAAVVVVKAFVTCGMLRDVLKEAVRCGAIATVVRGAVNGDALGDVLVEAKTSGFLSHVVQLCVQSKVIPLVSETIKFSTSLVKEAIKYEMLGDVLIEAAKLGEIATVVRGAVKGDVLGDVLVEAKTSGSLSHVVEHCVQSKGISLVAEAIRFGILKEVLKEILRCGAVSGLVENTFDFPSSMVSLFKKSMGFEEIWKLAHKVRNIADIQDEREQFVCSIMIYAEASRTLSATLMFLLDLNIPRDVILSAARNQGILEKLLLLISVLEVVTTVFALIVLETVSTKDQSRNTEHCTSDHRKCVIDHVTLLSGDIEKNPGPVFFFNDWLKEMFALVVRYAFGYHGKNIRWKEIGIPNPNTGLDRFAIVTLFRQHAQIVQDAEAQIPPTHTEEFQILKTYMRTGQEPDLGHLQKLVEKRKVKVNLQESLKKLQEQSSGDQREIVSCLDPHLITVLQNAVKTSQRNENEDSANLDTNDTGIGVTVPPSDDDESRDEHDESRDEQSARDESRDESSDKDESRDEPSDRQTVSDEEEVDSSPEQHLPEHLVSFVLENRNCHTVPSTIPLPSGSISSGVTPNTEVPGNTPMTQTTRGGNPTVKQKTETFGTRMLQLLYEMSPQVMPQMLETVMELSEQYLTDSDRNMSDENLTDKRKMMSDQYLTVTNSNMFVGVNFQKNHNMADTDNTESGVSRKRSRKDDIENGQISSKFLKIQ